MIIQRMHLQFKEKAQRLNSAHEIDLLPYQIDDLINDASDIFVEEYCYKNQFPYESTQQKVDMLESLVVKHGTEPDNQPNITPVLVGEQGGIYTYKFPLNSLNHEYIHAIRAFGIIGCCNVTNVKFVQHDDLNSYLSNEFLRPSQKWGRLLSVIASNHIYFYSDNTLTTVGLEYFKKPRRVFFGGYDTLEYLEAVKQGLPTTGLYNASTPPVDSDINEDYHRIVVDIAVREFSRRTDNQNKMLMVKDKLISET